MGYLHAVELSNMVEEGSVNLETAIRIHLTSNCYPPMPEQFVPICIEAINACNDGEYDKVIELPEDMIFRGGKPTAGNIADSLHLEAWLHADNEAF